MNEIYYESGSKVRIDLDHYPFWMQTGDFLDYRWGYVTKNNRITGFNKNIKEKEFKITVFGAFEAEYAGNWDHIHEVFEKDIYDMTPGRLHFGEYYLNCYIFASEKTEWEYDCNMHDNLYRLVTDYPFWIKEDAYHIPAVSIGDSFGFRGPSIYLENAHFADCHFSVKAYGPFDRLNFIINGDPYCVNTACGEGEYIILDTRDETITKHKLSRKQNVYSKQDFSFDNFKKIPPGLNVINYARTYPIDITLYYERSEPKWNDTLPAMWYSLMTEDGYSLTTEDGYYLLGEELSGGKS